jgi:hypothetical protein
MHNQTENKGPARPDGMDREVCNTGSRQSARGVLRMKIENMENELRELRELEKALPLELPERAEAALWKVLVASR